MGALRLRHQPVHFSQRSRIQSLQGTGRKPLTQCVASVKNQFYIFQIFCRSREDVSNEQQLDRQQPKQSAPTSRLRSPAAKPTHSTAEYPNHIRRGAPDLKICHDNETPRGPRKRATTTSPSIHPASGIAITQSSLLPASTRPVLTATTSTATTDREPCFPQTSGPRPRRPSYPHDGPRARLQRRRCQMGLEDHG